MWQLSFDSFKGKCLHAFDQRISILWEIGVLVSWGRGCLRPECLFISLWSFKVDSGFRNGKDILSFCFSLPPLSLGLFHKSFHQEDYYLKVPFQWHSHCVAAFLEERLYILTMWYTGRLSADDRDTGNRSENTDHLKPCPSFLNGKEFSDSTLRYWLIVAWW